MCVELTAGHGRVERLEARVGLAEHGVAAGDVVLRDAVHLGDPREVVAQEVLGLQRQHVLKVDQRLRKGWRGAGEGRGAGE